MYLIYFEARRRFILISAVLVLSFTVFCCVLPFYSNYLCLVLNKIYFAKLGFLVLELNV